MESGGGGGGAGSLLFPLLLLLALVFLFRGQRRRQRQLAQVQADLRPGAEVMTTAGLFGTVVGLEDNRLQLEVAPGIVCTYARQAVAQVLQSPPGGPDEASDAAGSGQPPS